LLLLLVATVVSAVVGDRTEAAIIGGIMLMSVGLSFLNEYRSDAFNVRSDPHGPIADFRAHSTEPIDLIVRQHDYQPHSTTGWHSHPGPVFITVTKGSLIYYELADPTCSPHVITAGHGFVDTGDGHVVRNESDQPAQDISVITAPVGGAFRTNLPVNANPACGF
jgi:quercetin dioxygenase-like cupin family protein